MRPVDVNKFKYKDKLASKRRHNFQIKTALISISVLVIFASIGYALFYTPWLKVTAVTYGGLTDGHQNDVGQIVDSALNSKVLGIPVGRNILFVRADSLEASLASKLSFIGNISIQKKYFHTLKITATERQAEGVWCFGSTALTTSPDCKYYDHDGVTFGQAVQSSGTLLLNVDDLRIQSASMSPATIDARFLKAIQTIVPVLTSQDVKVKNITIPADTYTEFNVLTGDTYVIKFSLDSDINGQLDVFRIFRTQKMTDGVLHPQYIDLRFDGRVYFK